MAKRKILSCALATFLGLSTIFGNIPVAPSYLTQEAVAAIKETTIASNEQEVVAEETQVDASNYGLCEYTKDGAILHAFCWSFNTIKQNMEDIAAAGYSTVQTSPINECLAGEGGGMQLFGNGKWYYHYQPTDWVIGNYQLGTREEYKAMCEEADKYGIKIISDVLPNHTTPTLEAVSDNLANAAGGKTAGALYHSNGFNEIGNYGDRYECTLGQMGGLPDVNTENQGFQEYYLKFCNDVIACGGDGFRYDTAKHIGVHSDPKDASNTRGENDFWDIATGAKAVNGVSLNRPDNFFIYGEVLQDNGIPYDEYASYMNMTASSYGYIIRGALGNYSLNTGSISDWSHATPDKIVTWVESHDTYCNEHESAWMNDWQLRAGWAVIAARGNGTPLFFSRPDGSDGASGNYWGNNLIGAKGNDQFKHPEVAACNHFRNAMVGESEYLSNPNGNSSVLVIERGTKGAVIINMGSSVSNIHLDKVADGTYLEEVSGQQVQVSGGTLNYTVPGGTIAVVYSGTAITKNPSVSVSKDSGTFSAPFELTLTPSNADNATYSINGGDEVSFTNTTKVTIGEGCEIGDIVTVKVTAAGEGDPFSKTYTYTMAETPEYKMYLRAKKSDFASVPTLYLYDSADKALNGAWPGSSMTAEGDYYIFTSDSLDSATAILVCGDWRSTADMEPGLSVSGYMEYDKSANKFTTFVLNPTTKTPAPIITKAPIITESPEPTEAPSKEMIQVSVADNSSFEEETLNVKIILSGETKGTYTVDDGPERSFQSGDSVTLGQGKIADTDITLKVKAGNETKTFTYRKVFNETTAVVKSSAISRIQNLFEVVADAAEVNGAPGSSYYATNPNGNVGTKKTITSASDFTEDMIIAQGVANDDPGTFRGTHEAPKFDPYSMYGAWDDENVYIGIQYTNVIDVVDPAQEAPQTGRGKPNGADADIPQMLVFDTRTGDYTDGTTNDTVQKTAWDTNVKFGGDAKVDKIFLYSPKDGIVNQAFFPVTNGLVDYDNVVKSGYNMPPIPGVETTWEDGFFGTSMYGIKGTGYTGYTPDDLESDSGDWVDFLSEGHSKEQDTFCIIKLPLSLLGVTASDIENNGIGVMAIATYGSSGIGSLPADMTMLDVAGEPYSKDDSTSQEKEDEDLVTVGLAQLGKSSGVIIPPTKKPVETETPASEAPDTTVPTQTSSPTDSTKYTVNFGADYSSPQYDSRKLTLKAIPYNGDGNCTFEFSVDGEILQNASSVATCSWNGKAGEHTIKVVVEDESGRKITCEKQYVIEAASGDNTQETSTPKETTKPSETRNPDNTGEPQKTETPRNTATPNVTEKPGETEKPRETEKPSNTQNPNTDGNGSQNGNNGEENGDENTNNSNVDIKIGLTVNSSTKSPQKAGENVIFAISVQSGGVAPYYYRLTAESPQGQIQTLYANNITKTTNVKWVPTKTGTYKIHATVTDGNGNYNIKTISYKVTTPIKISTFKANKKSVKKGKSVKFTFKATSIGKVKYRVKVQKVGSKKIKVVKKYSTTKKATWKPTAKGKYYIYLQVKDAKGNTKTKKLGKTIKVK